MGLIKEKIIGLFISLIAIALYILYLYVLWIFWDDRRYRLMVVYAIYMVQAWKEKYQGTKMLFEELSRIVVVYVVFFTYH